MNNLLPTGKSSTVLSLCKLNKWRSVAVNCTFTLEENSHFKQQWFLHFILVYNNHDNHDNHDTHAKRVAMPAYQRFKLLIWFGWTDRTGTNVTTTVKYKQMQIQSKVTYTVFSHWKSQTLFSELISITYIPGWFPWQHLPLDRYE